MTYARTYIILWHISRLVVSTFCHQYRPDKNLFQRIFGGALRARKGYVGGILDFVAQNIR